MYRRIQRSLRRCHLRSFFQEDFVSWAHLLPPARINRRPLNGVLFVWLEVCRQPLLAAWGIVPPPLILFILAKTCRSTFQLR
jgi:hypothetical protein